MIASFRPSLVRLLGVLAVLSLAVAACGGSAAIPNTDSGGAAGAPAPAATAGPAFGGTTDEERSLANVDATTGKGPLIVRTGQLNLEVAVLDDAIVAAERAVTAAGGYVAASQRQGDDENAGAMVTYRVPVERWEATLAALRKVGVKVLSEQTGSEEVTSQVVDLAARLTNLRATESALQAIMVKATKIPDILEVQAQLTGVRQEIEQLTAQKQSLEERAAMATLTVGYSLPPTVAVAAVQEGWDPADEVDRAAATLVGLGQGVANAAIWFVIVLLPLALVLGVLVGVAWLVARRFRPRPAPPAAPATLEAPAA
ncbi:MAG TPA: DUF4349 domain-containing protein [Candidatus Nanopelagicales bacterium]|nr:DUF4349 domain-containing protein [Candidatus Nanopelagicales bacterium]